MYGRKRSPVLGVFLSFLSLFYGLVVRLRLFAYARGLVRIKKITCPVISVGNITLGGTGKTPVVINVAGLLLARGRSPVVLSRGYGRKHGASIAVVSDGGHVILGPSESGDEPVLIANRLTTVPVVVGRDRYSAGAFAVGRFHPDVVILDDGFQHIRLARDLNIALIDASDPIGCGSLFPAGILREPLSALQRADIVVITKVDQAKDAVQLKELLGRYTSARILTARYVPRDLINVASGKILPLSDLRGSRVFTFAGIARPRSLDDLLRSLGAVIAGTASFADHYSYIEQDLEDVISSAADCKASMIVTTEKDGIRFKEIAPDGIWALRIDLEIIEQAVWEELLTGAL